MKIEMKNISVPGKIVAGFYRKAFEYQSLPGFFPGSCTYWKKRYDNGGNSGKGSYKKLADFKARVLNAFVERKNVHTVIELGCGDGNQLKLSDYPSYTGYDISETALAMCRKKFSSDSKKTFKKMTEYGGEKADLAISLDVIYHLVEEEIFNRYMNILFQSSRRFVIVYSSNTGQNSRFQCRHIKHRKFTDWIIENAPEWSLTKHLPNKYPIRGIFKTGSFSDFYFFEIKPEEQPKNGISPDRKKTARRSISRRAAPA